MGLAATVLVLFLSWSSTVSAGNPVIRIHRGYISVQDALYSSGMNSAYTVGQPYTFELYMENTHNQDYIIDQCTMNGAQFIGSYGCVQCSGTVLQSVETEQYTRAGAIKRTLVHFNAPDPNIHFVCQVRVLDCCGCAERSCERRPPLLGIITHAIPITCGIIAPVAAVGVYTQPVAYVPPIQHRDTYALGGGFVAGRTWLAGLPWWVWLLLFLLLLLLLLCCLACLLWACLRSMRRRKQKIVTTRIATIDENKAVGIQVGTEPVLTEKSVGTGGSLYKETVIQEKERTERIIPAIATDAGYHSHHREARGASRDTERINESFDATYTRRDRHDGGERYDTYGRDAAGAYSVREGRIVNERYHRGYAPQQPSPPDRSSYRNYAFERDMGRVAPMSGFDEVETLERRYCLSDDESEIVEKDIKRTHTTRFVQETRTVQDDQQSDNSSERYREEGEQHVVYAPQYRV